MRVVLTFSLQFPAFVLYSDILSRTFLQEFNAEMNDHLPQLERLLENGKALLESSPPGRAEALQEKLAALEGRGDELASKAGDRTAEIEAALLALQGLHDAVNKATSDLDQLEQEMTDQEEEPIGEDMNTVHAQLDKLNVSQGIWKLSSNIDSGDREDKLLDGPKTV